MSSLPVVLRASYYASGLLVCLLLGWGCAEMPDAANEGVDASLSGAVGEPAGDSLFALLRTLDAQSIEAAFDKLAESSYLRTIRTEQRSRDGALIAYRVRTVREEEGARTVVESDSSGSFEFGYLGRFSMAASELRPPDELAEIIVPDDPPYLSLRSREAYLYEASIDTLDGHGIVDVIDVRAHPEFGDDYAIRRARIYLADGDVAALRIQRTDAALWFGESSDLFVSLVKDDAAGWVPGEVRIESLLRMPFRPLQQFRTVSTFSDVRPRLSQQAGKAVVADDAR